MTCSNFYDDVSARKEKILVQNAATRRCGDVSQTSEVVMEKWRVFCEQKPVRDPLYSQ